MAINRNISADEFIEILSQRQLLLDREPTVHQDFVDEMKRFLPAKIVRETVLNADIRTFLRGLVREEWQNVTRTPKQDPNHAIHSSFRL